MKKACRRPYIVNRWREEFGVRDIKEEDIDEQDKKVNIYLFSSKLKFTLRTVKAISMSMKQSNGET
jgi:hypothetical protein